MTHIEDFPFTLLAGRGPNCLPDGALQWGPPLSHPPGRAIIDSAAQSIIFPPRSQESRAPGQDARSGDPGALIVWKYTSFYAHSQLHFCVHQTQTSFMKFANSIKGRSAIETKFSITPSLTSFSIIAFVPNVESKKMERRVQRTVNVGAPGLVNFITSLLRPSLPAAFTQPGASTLADPCTCSIFCPAQ